MNDINRRYNFSDYVVRLDDSKVISLPLIRFLKYFIISFFIMFFALGSVSAPINKGALFAATNKKEERAMLEEKLEQLEKEISEYEQQASDYRKKGKALESEVKVLNAKIAKLNLQIKSVLLNLNSLDKEINSTRYKIKKLKNDISDKKSILSELLLDVYKNDNKNAIEMMMENPRLSDFFMNLNNLMVLQDKVSIAVDQLMSLRNDLISQKEQLALEYEDAEKLKKYQEKQKQSIKKIEANKKILLSNTKKAEKKVSELLEEKKQTAAQIRSRIFELIGGGELSFGEAYRLAKIAFSATGIKPSLLLAVLDRESALGKNVGKCEYNKNPYYPTKASNPTTMHPTRDIPIFLDLLTRLKKSGVPIPNPPFVSCPIPRDGAYGGAMGPAQFIPSTWKIYENRIAKISGHNPPSPWNNLDAFIATALYLSDAYNSSSCVGYANKYSQYNSEILRNRCAAAKYYAGSRWWNYRWIYGEATLERAKKFEEDIKILNG